MQQHNVYVAIMLTHNVDPDPQFYTDQELLISLQISLIELVVIIILNIQSFCLIEFDDIFLRSFVT
jgi:hypothetical protein